MVTNAVLALLVLTTLSAVADESLVTRAEKTELLQAEKALIPRVERDADGNVIRLQLNDMQLTAEEFAQVGRLTHLQRLVLFKTNVRDEDLRFLSGLQELKGLNLTHTEISDAAIDEIVKLKGLKSLCLGSVDISPAAIARMKDEFRSRNQKVSLGYGRRKKQ